MAEPTLPEICQALRIGPGQTLILRFSPDRHLTRERVDGMREHLDEHAPELKVLIVVADEIAVAETTP